MPSRAFSAHLAQSREPVIRPLQPVGGFSSRLARSKHVFQDEPGKGNFEVGGSVSSTSCAVYAEAGARLLRTARCGGKAIPPQDVPELEQDALSLLRCLRIGYCERSFQSEIIQLKHKHCNDELGFLTALGKVASTVQDPIFEQFGLPKGHRGVMLMKMATKAIAEFCPTVKQTAGDLRELLGLARVEVEIGVKDMLKTADDHQKDLTERLARAPVDVRGPLAEALRLPYKASPAEIAQEVPRIKEIAERLADKNIDVPVAELTGPGKLLGPEAIGAPPEQIRSLLVDSFENYLNKLLARVITTVESFTQPPENFRNAWADELIDTCHVRELWGRPPDSSQKLGCNATQWKSLGVGITVMDGVIPADIATSALKELATLEAEGQLRVSKDACNVGARSIWLHCETTEERKAIPQSLGKICDRLLGLPSALMKTVVEHVADSSEGLAAPTLRVHPHIMAATYRTGAEYHVHKDSYNGTDNQRMVTILLYLSDGWEDGDGGELRVFGTRTTPSGKMEADECRFVDIAPLAGRLVLLRSREVWHAVRTPREQRWALTLWVMAA